MTNQYVPLLFLAAIGGAFAVFSVVAGAFAGAFSKLGLFALVEMVLFIITVFVAYAYVWRRGGLEWD